MKTTNKIISVLLSILMIFTCFESVALAADSNGSGTAEDPFKISTASQLQNINNNISAHYILTADIDLRNADFTPIGNADSGAFSGSFNGNGHTIKNLNVFSGKYAGLFGCNEGIIKNVKLENIYVYGTRYVGGVVGQNTELGRVESCSVLSGEVESDGGIYSAYGGGICGYNQGSFIGPSSNGANILVKNTRGCYNDFAGGLIGFTSSALELANSYNKGQVYASNSVRNYDNVYYSSCAGGLIGYMGGGMDSKITNSYNTGVVNSGMRGLYRSGSCSGGLVGIGSPTITGSYNTGNVSGSVSDVGGLVGYGSPTITGSYNTGNVSGDNSRVGGLVGYGSPTITGSYNTGNVSGDNSSVGGLVGYGSPTITGSYNTGNVSGDNSSVGGLVGLGSNTTINSSYNAGFLGSYAGGLVGRIYGGTSTITNSYNSGDISGYGGLIGIVDRNYSSVISITNSYNCGAVFKGIIGLNDSFYSTVTITGTYVLATAKSSSTNSVKHLLSDAQMKTQASFVDWDFDEVWEMPSTGNNGYPVLKGVRSHLYFDRETTIMYLNSTFQLTAYKDGIKTTNVTWESTSDKCIVTKYGKVTATGTGVSTIIATDSQGNKANCHIYVMERNTDTAIGNFTCNQGESVTRSITLGNTSSGDFIINASSSDSSIIEVTGFGSTSIAVKAIKPGSATISYETYQGFKGSCTATVTNHTNSVNITLSSLNMKVGESFKLTATTTPTVSSDPIIWTSEDNTIAKVDSNGNVTAVTEGKTKIVATSNGYKDTCDVIVTKKLKPVTSMNFTDVDINIYINDQKQLQLVYDPADTTDTITYSSDNTSVATVSSSGLLTAKASGTAKIAATSSSGVKTYCNVTVKNYPVVVTGITLDINEKDLLVGEVFKLTSTVTPSNATAPGVTWNSTDPTVATVTQAGTVEAIGAGKTLITAETENGIIAYCTVNVTGVASTNLSKIYVPNVVASESTTVDIPVMIERNPGISFASISVIYNPDVMEAISVENGDVFGSVMGNIDEKNATVKLFFTSDTDIDTDGVLAKIKFNIIDPNTEADVKVCYFPSEIRNSENTAVAFNLFDGRYSQPVCTHKETEIKNALDATCTKDGYTGDTYCKECHSLISTGEKTDAIGHTEVVDVRKDATCTETGLTEGKHCSVCNEVLVKQETVKATGHKYTSKVTKAATCKQAGIMTYTCSCGESYTETIAKTAHKLVTIPAVSATCSKAGSTAGTKCSVCGTVTVAPKAIAKKAHAYKKTTTKATTSKNGSVVEKCTACGNVKSNVAIAKVSTVKLSKTSFTYNGKTQKPSVTVKDSKGKTLKNGTDYTVKYSKGCKNVGQYTVTITFKGNYSGTKTLTFNIIPKKGSISKLTAGKKQFTVKWNKDSQGSGYEIQYSTSSKMKNAKTVKIGKSGTTSTTIKKLKSGKKYYVRVRTYKTIKVNGKSVKLYSSWSKVKNIKAK